MSGSTPPPIFFQIKSIFHILESVGSARIEGNRTTVQEYVEVKLEDKQNESESNKEIANMERALDFIDKNIEENPINRVFVCELHKIVVDGLTTEGSQWPSEYRKNEVKIKGSEHIVPPQYLVEKYMEELLNFINKEDADKYDLLKTAIAHHRFVWIHPFDNGNGRTVRMFTYAMLVKLGFNVNLGRILNPTAVFCQNRKQYYAHLSRADKGDKMGFLEWSNYMLSGLRREIEKIDNLLNYDYLSKKILLPAVDISLDRKLINERESKILKLAIEKKQVTNSDIKQNVLPAQHMSEISRIIRGLKDKKMISPVDKGKRKYLICFQNNFLLRGIIQSLEANGFLPENLLA